MGSGGRTRFPVVGSSGRRRGPALRTRLILWAAPSGRMPRSWRRRDSSGVAPGRLPPKRVSLPDSTWGLEASPQPNGLGLLRDLGGACVLGLVPVRKTPICGVAFLPRSSAYRSCACVARSSAPCTWGISERALTRCPLERVQSSVAFSTDLSKTRNFKMDSRASQGDSSGRTRSLPKK